MHVKLLIVIFLIISPYTFSQTKKILTGKAISQNEALKDVEVINKTTKISTKTNVLGEFSISVAPEDSLIFFAKNYYFKRVKIAANDFDNNFTVNMIVQPLELNEIIVSNNKITDVRLSKEDIRSIKLNSSRPRPGLQIAGYKEMTIPNGIDFIRVGKQILELIKKEKPVVKKIPKANFVDYLNSTITADFFIKDLKLKPEEKALFIQFCEADPKSSEVVENNNILNTMDFLYYKNTEFKELTIKN